MKIGAYHKCSMIDYEGHLASVIFTVGCNMSCGYCHNAGLCSLTTAPSVSVDAVLKHLEKRKGMLDGVVISGGEPTLHKDLPELMKYIKNMGYKIKLDTNGTNPEMVGLIIRQGLADYIAMDIKATPKMYKAVSGVAYEKVEESISLLREFGQYEFRTTVYPQISLGGVERLCQVYRFDPYWLQQYRRVSEDGLQPYDDLVLFEMAKKYGVETRGITKEIDRILI